MLEMPRAIVREIAAEAKAALPNECCGLLAGRGEVVERLFAMTNVESSPTRYFMDAREQFEVARKVREAGMELVGVYHSHPNSPPYPSLRDIERAFCPGLVHVIVSLSGMEAEMRAFRIAEGTVSEVGLRVS